MDFIRVELEEKYIADVESREECERSVLPLVCILKVVIFPDEAHLFIL